MKPGVRIAAVASAPIGGGAGKRRRVLVACVIARDSLIEGVLSCSVQVDGTDATTRITSMIRKSRFREQVRLLALNGVAIAGLNVVDAGRIARSLGVEFAIVTRKRPRKSLLIRALRRLSYETGMPVESRIALVDEIAKVRRVRLNRMFVQASTVMDKELSGYAFSALRVAHLVASGISKGESKGRI